ncbi:CDK5 regulatory subunit-associated protein 3 isoform X2 [Maniola hyperantus]|uniref:CDK5 regulatory subunit-associated protein 3 isoform X2 n=1 Tax=Aphantopus hyperantus TaxID=2795564 RepID=UPI0037479999
MDESNIPIDINIGKLQDWLVSRRHVNKEWQKNVIAAREKINNAIQDMPAHEDIAALLSGSYINYFHCLKIIEILKETEADTKNLFGRYGSQRMKDWQDVVRSYEKDNLYLAEAAQIFVRNITYEIPSLKKQIAKEEQMQIECEKKESEYLKSQASSKSEFQSLCKQLGIKGDRIKRELLERLQGLPHIYDKIGKSLRPLQPGIELYSAFTKYILGEQASELLPLLQYVAEHGNTTVYQWSYGEPPLTVEPDPIHIELEDDQAAGDQIDFGESVEIEFGAVDAAAEIDFGDGDAAAEIDWGNLDAAADEFACISGRGGGHIGDLAGRERHCGGVCRGRGGRGAREGGAHRAGLHHHQESVPRPAAGVGVVPQDASVRNERGEREPHVLAHRAAADRERGGPCGHVGGRAGGHVGHVGARDHASAQRQALTQIRGRAVGAAAAEAVRVRQAGAAGGALGGARPQRGRQSRRAAALAGEDDRAHQGAAG